MTPRPPLIKYEDFSHAGLVLITPSAPEFEALAAQIQARSSEAKRLDQRDEGSINVESALSVIFSNESGRPIILLQICWIFRTPDGTEFLASQADVGSASLLLPVPFPPKARPALHYRLGILSGSKRYLTNTGQVTGDNGDVRPPTAEEQWEGGWVDGLAGGSCTPRALTQVTAIVEGAVFDDGEFAGTNRTKMLERLAAKQKAYLQIAAMVHDNNKGGTASDVLNKIRESATAIQDLPQIIPLLHGTNLPTSVYDAVAFRDLAATVDKVRAREDDAAAFAMMRAWGSEPLPVLRKLVSH